MFFIFLRLFSFNKIPFPGIADDSACKVSPLTMNSHLNALIKKSYRICYLIDYQ